MSVDYKTPCAAGHDFCGTRISVDWVLDGSQKIKDCFCISMIKRKHKNARWHEKAFRAAFI